jgi:DNA-binding NarL/FixJ family response regulator
MRVLLVDDHPLILSALQLIINNMGQQDTDVVCVSNAQQANDVLCLHDSGINMILLDLKLEGSVSGFDLLGDWRNLYPHIPVVVISASEEVQDVLHALDLGAMAYVSKRSDSNTLIEAMQTVLAGNVYVPQFALTAQHNNGHQKHQANAEVSAKLEQLTSRQREVLALMLQGKSNKIIARELGVALETIKAHVAGVLRTLEVSSRTQAVLLVSQLTTSATHIKKP